MEETLENLKVGDKVFYDGDYGFCKIVTVLRLTAKQIVIYGDSKFWKRGGYIVGRNDFIHTMIRPLTPERIEKVEVEKLTKEARILREKLAIPQDKETLIKLIAALKPFVEGK